MAIGHHHRAACLAIGGLVMLAALIGCDREPAPQVAPAADTPADSAARYGRRDERATRARFTAAEPAPKPTAALPEDASCVTPECHAGYAIARFVHAPVAADSCLSCHEPDAGGHVYPLARDDNDTCTFCHAVVGAREHTHEAVTTQGCVTCHDPHAAPTRNLVREISVERLCARCHDVPLRSFGHEPFLEGQCMVCHEPHESNFQPLLRGAEGAALCFTCHRNIEQRITTAANVHEPAREDCAQCHDAHTSANRFQLHLPMQQMCFSCHPMLESQVLAARFTHGAMTQGHACGNCHDTHAANEPNLLTDREDRVCLTCHDRALESPDGRRIADMSDKLDRRHLHGPIRLGECSPCHGAHGADNANLLTTPFPPTFYAPFELDNYALCFTCHEQELVTSETTAALTGFRDGDRNLHFVHVNRQDKGRTCKTCHDIHGSDLPDHVARTVPFEGSNWAMPIRYEQLDDGGRCAPGCHEPMDYHRTAGRRMTSSLPREGDRPLTPSPRRGEGWGEGQNRGVVPGSATNLQPPPALDPSPGGKGEEEPHDAATSESRSVHRGAS